jgi:short-subunit dehydrogenase
MALAESIHGDLRHTNVTVQLANPGYIDTRMQTDNPHSKPMMMSPDEAAQEVFDQMNGDSVSQGVPIPLQPAFPLVPVPAHGALRGDLLPPVA